MTFIKKTLKLEAVICRCVFCLITEKKRIKYNKEIDINLSEVANYAKLWDCIFPAIFKWVSD